MLRQNHKRALLSFLGGGLLASLIVVGLQRHPYDSNPAELASVATAGKMNSATATPVPTPAREIVVERVEPKTDDAPEPDSESTAVTTHTLTSGETKPAAEQAPPPAPAPESASRGSAVPPSVASSVATPEPGAAAHNSCPCPGDESDLGTAQAAKVSQTQPMDSAPPVTRAVNSLVLGPGTPLAVRLNETLSTRHTRRGENFTGVLEEPIVVNGFVAADRGARVEGTVVRADGTSRIRGLARMSVVLTGLDAIGGQHLNVTSYPIEVEGPNIIGVQSLKTGASTTVGAVVGVVAGRTPGSAIGSLIGGVIGTSGAILTGGKPAVLSAQQTINFRLREPVTITEHVLSASQ